MDIIIFCLETTNPHFIGTQDYPLSLIGLGNTPSICILLEEIVQSINIHSCTTIYIACPHIIMRSFQIELERIYPYYENIKVVETPIDFNMNDTGQLQSVLRKYDIQKTCVLIRHRYFPLLSSSSFSCFFRECSRDTTYAVMCSNTFQSHQLEDNMVDLYVIGTTTDLTETSFRSIGLFMDNRFLYSEPLYLSLDVFFIDTLDFLKQDTNHSFYTILNTNTFHEIIVITRRNKIEATRMVSYADKKYIENHYLEKKNLDFLHQAFVLWKQCLELEQKIVKIEEKLDYICSICAQWINHQQ